MKEKIVVEVGEDKYTWGHGHIPLTLTYVILRDIVKRIEDGDVFLDDSDEDLEEGMTVEDAYREILEVKAMADKPGFWKKFRTDDAPAPRAKKKAGKKTAKKKVAKKAAAKK